MEGNRMNLYLSSFQVFLSRHCFRLGLAYIFVRCLPSFLPCSLAWLLPCFPFLSLWIFLSVFHFFFLSFSTLLGFLLQVEEEVPAFAL